MRRLVPLLLLALLSLVPSVTAHASLLRAAPTPGAHLDTAPTEAWIEFNEEVEPTVTRFEVYSSPNNTRIDLPDTLTVTGTGAHVQLQQNLTDGGYVARWAATSTTDGHESSGAWAFSIGKGSVPDLPPETETAPPFPWGTAVGKGFAFVGLALMSGFTAFRLWILKMPTYALPRIVRSTSLVGVVLLIIGLTAYLLDQGLRGQGSLADYTLHTSFGRGLGIRLGLAFLMLAAISIDIAAKRRATAIAPTILLVVSLLAAGYYSHTAAQAQNRIGGALIDAVHLLGATMWAGGLVYLFSIVTRAAPTPSIPLVLQTSRRFSGLAQASIILLVTTGSLMLATILGTDVATWPNKLRTMYGLVLAYKIGLAVLMMGLGATNHFFFVRRFERQQTVSNVDWFRANVRRETVNGILVLVVAALLTNLAPA